MGGRLLRAGLGLLGCAVVAAGLGACETILGLDETLSEDEGGIVVPFDGSTSDGGAHDATTDTGQSGAEAGGDDGAEDAGKPWAVDPTFGDGGVMILLPPLQTVALPGTLEITLVVIASNTFVDVLAVGQSSLDAGRQVIVDYTFAGAVDGGVVTSTLDGGANHLLGVLTTPSNVSPSTRAVLENSAREVYSYDLVYKFVLGAIANDSGAEIARVTEATSAGFEGPGLLPGGGVEATVGIASVVATGIRETRGDILLAEATGDGGNWFGGYQAGSDAQAAVMLFASTNESSFAQVQEADAGDDFAVTDFAVTDGGLFAVGYSGGSFAVWPAMLDFPAPRTIPAGQSFTAAPPYRSDYPYSFVRAAVTEDGHIFLSGAFGAPFLATFDAKGVPAPVLAQPDGGGFASLLDLTPTLPRARDGGVQVWLPGGLLVNGGYLYATFASGLTNTQWVVVRLGQAP